MKLKNKDLNNYYNILKSFHLGLIDINVFKKYLGHLTLKDLNYISNYKRD